MKFRYSKSQQTLIAENMRFLKRFVSKNLPLVLLEQLRELTRNFSLSLKCGDLLLLDGGWYVTHSGLLRLAERRRCAGIHCRPVLESSDPAISRWIFKATVFKSRACRGFEGHGDASPGNISPTVQGAEMRVAESRAVDRALREAYGIGVCSVSEAASFAGQSASSPESKKSPQPASCDGNHGSPKVRDRLCQIIRQHQLDPSLVKAYATDFCGVKTLREATREQVENFIAHLADWAEKDRNALLCQLNSYPNQKEEGAA